MAFWKIKLRTLLLSVFLGTFIASSGLIIAFTYLKYSKSIHEYSLATVERAGHRISDKMSCFIRETEELPTLGNMFFEHYPEIDIKNVNLITFFLGILKHDPNLFAYHLGLPNGSYLEAIDLELYKSYPPDFSPVPQEAVYLVKIMNRALPDRFETQGFFNKDSDLILTRERPSNYNPREFPWYAEAVIAKTLYWTDPFPDPHLKSNTGLSVSIPYYDKAGQLTSIIGADLSLSLFSQFLQEQFLSKNGTAYILDQEGRILLPEGVESDVQKRLVAKAFTTFEKTKSSNFSYVFEKETYLASFHDFPISYNKDWRILFISPRSEFFSDFISTQRIAVLLSLAILSVASFLVVIVSIHISKPIMQLGNEIDRIARLDLESKNRTFSHIVELHSIDASVASMRTALRSFAHYVPKELAKQLMRKEHEIALGGEKKNLTIFFTDIANFTAIAEPLPVEQVNVLLSEYFELLTQIILDCGGTIDKYIGDSIMSIWGAPEDLPDFTTRACKAALLCQHRLSILHEKRRKEQLPVFETRMGINTGPAFVGNFGTAERMNYSAIGDAVNTAARLQALNKTYRTRIIVSEETFIAAGPKFLGRPLELVEVRGKKNKLKIFELVAFENKEPEIRPRPEQIELCALFTRAYNSFEQGDLEGAKRLFKEIQKKFPDDYPTQLYLERLK